jgi:hypothetical protein
MRAKQQATGLLHGALSRRIIHAALYKTSLAPQPNANLTVARLST